MCYHTALTLGEKGMSTREVLAIAIKLFSIWVLVQVFWMSPGLIALLASIESWQGNVLPDWVYVASITAFIGVGAAIAIALYQISNSVLTTSPSKGDIEASEQTKRFLLQLGGVYFLITALVYFPPSISFIWQPNPAQESYPFHYFFRPFSNILQALVGLWLILHPSWWSLILHKFRGRA